MRTLLITLLMPGAASAATLNVGAGQPYTTIAAAVRAAADGDRIVIQAGRYAEPIEIQNRELDFEGVGVVDWVATSENIVAAYDSELSFTGIQFHPDGGRAIRASDSIVRITACELSGNSTRNQASNGAAIAVYDGSDVAVADSTFRDNASLPDFFGQYEGRGGSVYIVDGTFSCEGCTFEDGSAATGGAIHAAGTSSVRLTSSSFVGLSASDLGGALFFTEDVTATLRDVRLSNNSSDGNGGAIRFESGSGSSSLTLERCTLAQNESAAYGGALAVNGLDTLNLVDATFTDNTGEDGGGAISLAAVGEVVMRRSVVCANRSDGDGGGVRMSDVDASVLRNNIFADNTAGDDGGGLYIDGGEHEVWNNDLLDGEAADNGGGVLLQNADVVFRNNLVAWSADYGVETSGNAALDYNGWFSNTPGDMPNNRERGQNVVSGDPLFIAYADDGACVDDVRLALGSPMINTGDPAVSDLDGTRSDIGAFGGPDAPASIFVDTDTDGTVDAYDCAPTDPTVFPGAVETCDGIDTDCNGVIDGPNPLGAPSWFLDRDRDGFGAGAAIVACTQPPGTSTTDTDCDDRNADVNPDFEEICDNIDNDCDGVTDTDAVYAPLWFEDADGDGYGEAGATFGACTQPAGYSDVDTDCDDTNAQISPAGTELCNDVDDDCDGTIDEEAADRPSWYADGDGDGWGAAGPQTRLDCDRPAGDWSRSDDDCDDADPTVNPRAEEDCEDLTDKNCDGSTGQQDLDADGVVACEDCDDQDPLTFPGAPDVWYDGEIQDCARASDFDADLDGFESDGFGGDDCDDANSLVNPAATEFYDDEIDSDCDGDIGVDPFFDEKLIAGCGACNQGGSSGGGALLAALAAVFTARRRRA